MRALLLLLLCLSCRSTDKGEDSGRSNEPVDSDGDGVLDVLDCAPEDPSASPAASEVCDDVDNDCDGDVDELALDAVTCYPDRDGDGYGDAQGEGELRCACDEGSSEDNTDCDDQEFYSNPGEAEVCGDGLDNDCLDGVDDPGAENAALWYLDEDGDGHGGDAAEGVPGCAAPEGYVNSSDDCDDLDPDVLPGADERCDGLDDDCDGVIDDGATLDTARWFQDADGDGFGDEGALLEACEDAPPDGYVSDSTDCDDSSSGTNPAATESCDGLDNDCDGDVDEEGKTTYHLDSDGDGYGDPDKERDVCDIFATEVMVLDDTDCDDSDEGVNPGADETCDGEDDDCDGDVDEDSAVDAEAWYSDADGDGYGAADVVTVSCLQPDSTVSESDYEAAPDCDDTDPDISPEANEICGGGDEDCDGFIDETGASGGSVWYQDVDGDGFGTRDARVRACSTPLGYAPLPTDCDDTDATVSPAASELCDVTVDNDCDGDIDEVGAVDGDTCYRDRDGDGYGDDTQTIAACNVPTGYAAVGGDTDDSDPLTH